MDHIENESQTSIYDEVVVIAYGEQNFSVVRIKGEERHNIECGISELKIALAIKKAYCDGYYDGKREQ